MWSVFRRCTPRLGWGLLVVAAAAAAGRAEAATNLLRNSGFLECHNPGVPDWWGTSAPETIQEWPGCYGTDAEAPVAGVRSLRLACPPGAAAIRVQSFAYSLASGRPYCYSVYLKASVAGLPAGLAVGEQTKSVSVSTAWQRYTLVASPKDGHWAPGRLVVRFSVQAPGTLWVAAPQLEYGSAATEYHAADADAQSSTAGADPAAPTPAVEPPPRAECPVVDRSPVIDGQVDEAAYRDATRLRAFRLLASGRPADPPTECWIAHDRTALYVAVRCHEPYMDRLAATVTQADGSVFEDDSIEIFLRPDPASPVYYHLAFNTLGTRFDERQVDPGWDAEWKAAVALGPDEWSAEVRVPFASLDLTPTTAEVWGMNVCRNRPRSDGRTLSQWSVTGSSYHVPSRFGLVSGFSARDLKPYLRAPAAPAAGSAATGPGAALEATFELSYYTTEAEARLWVRSGLPQKAYVQLELRGPAGTSLGRVRPAAAAPGDKPPRLSPGTSQSIPYDVSFLPAGEYEAVVTAESKDGEESARMTTPLVRLSPGPVEVKMDRVNRHLVVNGKPFLVYAQGIHSGRMQDWWLRDIAAHGFNTVVHNCPAYRSDAELDAAEPRLRAFLDDCQRQGLAVILWLSPGGGPYPALREGVVRTITRLKDHPNVLCWYLVDEPEFWWGKQAGGKKPDDLVDLYQAARRADPYRPSHINWCLWSRGKGGYGSLDATDIGAMDRYPVGRGSHAVAAVGDLAVTMNADCAPRRQPTAYWVQMYGYDDAVREPTPVEMRGMTYAALVHGTRLMYYFIYKPVSPDLWESMSGLGEEMRWLGPRLTGPEVRCVATGVERDTVHYAVLQTGPEQYLLLAANGSDTDAPLALDLKKLGCSPVPDKARPQFGSGPLKLKRGKLSTTLAAGDRLVVELAD